MADLHPDDQISLPVPRYSAILYLYRATGDHDLFADMSPRFGEPAIDPLAVTAMRLVAADERHLPGPGDRPRLSIAELPSK